MSNFGLSCIEIMGIQKSIEEILFKKMHREVKVLMYMERSVFLQYAREFFCPTKQFKE